LYHDGNRSLQDRFDSRRIADRLVEVLHRVRFTSEDREFIESRSMFFLANPRVGMLFMDFAQPKRLRVNGTASIDFSDPLLRSFEGAQLVVRVRAEHIFPNCPRYIHRMAIEEISVYAPAAGHEPPTPAWKEMEAFRDYLPR
jgi:hypothetical protein